MSLRSQHCSRLRAALAIGSTFLTWGAFGCLGVEAQITPDASLPTNSQVVPATINCPAACIQGGTQLGTTNLFHSFLEFNVGSGETVTFFDPGVTNIFARVTGNNGSTISGTLGTSIGSTANLFLLNPNGIVFGPNATLRVGGSFFATTASSISFAGGGEFSTASPEASLLTVNVPIGLQFNGSQGAIVNQSRFGGFVGLQVPTGYTLALVGGEVRFESGRVTASSGRIELGAVGGTNLVSLSNPNPQTWEVSYAGVSQFQDLQVSATLNAPFSGNISVVNASGSRGGAVQIIGQDITITTSFIFAATTGDGQGGDVVIRGEQIKLSGGSQVQVETRSGTTGTAGNLAITATESIDLSGSILSGTNRFPTALFARTSGSGSAGNLTINAPLVRLQDGAQASASTSSTGQGGTLTVNATVVEVLGTSAEPDVQESGLFSQSFDGATGNAGGLTVNANTVTVLGGGRISGASEGAGQAGNLTINANTLNVGGAGSEVTVSGTGAGAAGNLTILALNVRLSDRGSLQGNTQGGQGNIIISARDLRLTGGSGISTNATGAATGGNITITTDALVAFENSDITANAEESFGGRVTISAIGVFGTQFRDQLTPESDITATSALGPQFSGDVTIQTPDVNPASGLVDLKTDVVDPAGLIAQGCGRGGQSSEFVITGRGGLPPNPAEPLVNQSVQVDLGPNLPAQASPASSSDQGSPRVAADPPSTSPLVQAQGWMVNSRGEVVLLAQTDSRRPIVPWISPDACNAP